MGVRSMSHSDNHIWSYYQIWEDFAIWKLRRRYYYYISLPFSAKAILQTQIVFEFCHIKCGSIQSA